VLELETPLSTSTAKNKIILNVNIICVTIRRKTTESGRCKPSKEELVKCQPNPKSYSHHHHHHHHHHNYKQHLRTDVSRNESNHYHHYSSNHNRTQHTNNSTSQGHTRKRSLSQGGGVIIA